MFEMKGAGPGGKAGDPVAPSDKGPVTHFYTVKMNSYGKMIDLGFGGHNELSREDPCKPDAGARMYVVTEPTLQRFSS
jgi:hypothetical protein